MPLHKDSIVLLSSTEENNDNFGTGFIVAHAHDQGYSYLLTSAHVLEDINGKPPTSKNTLKISGLNAQVDIVACGASDGIDMALLKVRGLLDRPLFKQFMVGQEKAEVFVHGYSWFDPGKQQHIKRWLKGTLSKQTQVTSLGKEYPFSDLIIQDDDFSKLEHGYSGSPLYNSSGHVLGVVSHKRTGEMGHAFCISNLAVLYPEIDSLLPNFNRQIEKNARLWQIRTQLLGRMAETPEIFLTVVKRLKQIEKAGIDDEADLILQRCESFLNDEIDEAEFNDFCQSLDPTGTAQPNYPLLAQRFKNAEICLFLGTELPKLFDAKLKSAQELPHRIAALTGFAVANSRALAESCEYGELHTGCTRHSVVSELKQLLTPPPDYQPNNALFDLLIKLEKPFLVIATGFDTLLEQHLGRSKQRFVSIVTNVAAEAENQRYLLKTYNAQLGDQPIPPSCSNEGLSALKLMEQGYALIFYPRGYHDVSETLLLSERDYFFNANEVLKTPYPAYLHIKLKTFGLWFLGYQPDSWETRLLAKALQLPRQQNRDRPIVIEPNVEPFAQLFWQDMQCSLYPELTVTEFVAKIGALL